MNKLDKQYQDLLQTILDYGVEKKDRTGTGTKSIFGYTIRHNMKDGFPVLTTKKMAFKTMVTELLWFLRGDTNIKFLVENGCHIWDGDAYKNYISKTNEYKGDWPDTMDEFIERIKTDDKFAKKWGELGPVYGRQWRSWSAGVLEDKHGLGNIDQITNLISDLKTNPDSRRLMVTAWNVGELDQMVLPPCHYGFQVYTRELSWEERRDLLTKEQFRDEFGYLSPFTEPIINYYLNSKNIPKRAISLMWNQRSVDTFLGLPFNIASYGLLLTILAKEVNMIPDQLIGNLGDTHLYLNHIEQAKEQIGREPFELPTLNQFPTYEGSRLSIESYVVSDFTLKDYQSHPSIKAPLSN
jgi:thymidylate synthase